MITAQSVSSGSLAEWFKAPDLGSGIFGCVSSNLTALIFTFHCDTHSHNPSSTEAGMVVCTPRLWESCRADSVPCTSEVLLSKTYSQA